jgi:hypothetical protein
MPPLITQAIDDQPQILLLTDSPIFSQEIQAVLEEAQLQVLSTSISNLVKSEQVKRGRVQNNQVKSDAELFGQQVEFYKIITVLGFEGDYPPSLDSLSKKTGSKPSVKSPLISFLERRSEPKIIICRGLSGVEFSKQTPSTQEKPFTLWQQQWQRYTKFASQVAQLDNLLKLIIGQDVVSPEALLYPLRGFVFNVSRDQVFNPGVKTNFLSTQKFIKTISPELFKPGEKQVLIKGKSYPGSRVSQQIQRLLQLYYRQTPVVKEIDLKSTHLRPPLDQLVEVVIQDELESVIDSSIRNLPQQDFSAERELIEQRQGPVFHTEAVDANAITNIENKNGESNEVGSKPKVNKIGFGRSGTGGIKTSKSGFDEKQGDKSANTSITEDVSQFFVRATQQSPELGVAYTKRTANQSSNPLSRPPTPSKQEKSQIDSDLQRIFNTNRIQAKTKRRAQKATIFSKIKHKAKHKKLVFWLGLVGILVFLGGGLNFSLMLLNYKKSKQQLVQALTLVPQTPAAQYSTQHSSQYATQHSDGGGDDDNNGSGGGKADSVNKLKTTQLNFSTLQRQTKLLSQLVDLDLVQNSQDLISLASKINAALTTTQQLIETDRQILAHFVNLQAENPSLVLEEKIEVSSKLYQQLSVLQAELEAIGLSQFDPEQQNQIKQVKQNLTDYRKKIAVQQQFNPLLSQLLAIEGEKLYLVVLQDNQEIRSTGGFVQAAALITVQDGQIVNTQVMSASHIDQKVKAQLPAPPELKTLLGEDVLHFRDVNWDPNFPSTAKKIAWFVKEATGREIDGVMMINYYLVQDLLQDWGSVVVRGYQEELTSSNLFEKLKYYASEEKQQVSKQTFHTQILNSVLNKFKKSSPGELQAAMYSINQSFNSSQALLSVFKPEVKTILKDLNWAGLIVSPNCPSQFQQVGQCFVDTFYQVESNVGVNKVNPYISRTSEHLISIEDGQPINHQRKIVLRNEARSQIWPLGTYKVYLRFYLTPEVNLHQVVVDGTKIADENLVNYLDYNRKVVGLLIKVPPGKEKELVLDYSTPTQISSNQAYLFFDQQQPGVKTDEQKIVIDNQSSLTPKLVAPQAEVYQQLIDFKTDLQGHDFVGIQF